MIGIRKLDSYILKKFLLLFVAAFFICLFIFMMQFTWKYIDELIGKGLTLGILAQFYWYMALTLIPQALPLAVLLASLITFGNLGESLELLAIKAAGIPLIRVMRPVMFFSILTGAVSFYFQNVTSPEAQVSLSTLLFSLKQQTPAVEIPEGMFYSNIPNINIYVQKKHAQTGMLYQLIIYKTDQGFDRAQIVLADSGKLEMTRDKLHLKLSMWNGTQFESLESSGAGQMMQSGAESPYDRETFNFKQFIIDFDSNFNLLDKDLLSNTPAAKSMKQIEHSIDSMECELDSVGKAYYTAAKRSYYRSPSLAKKDSLRLLATIKAKPLPFDSILPSLEATRQQAAMQSARSAVQQMKSDLEWKLLTTKDGDTYIRRHQAEWHKKITLSLACIFFFFVGAPLGAIIRRGGLGLPTVVSVIIFIIWYIINTSGFKTARDGSISMVVGMWMSTAVLVPTGIFLTYKANRDSVVFNLDAYVAIVRRLLGLRSKRHIFRKEVIIDDPRMEFVPEQIEQLRSACRAYNEKKQLLRAPSYVKIFFRHETDNEVIAINERMEALIEELSNSRNRTILALLCEFPFIYTSAHTSPFASRQLNIAAGIIFPVGCILWFRIWRFRLRLLRDMRVIVRTCNRLDDVISGIGQKTGDEQDSQPAPTAHDEARAALRRRITRWVILVAICALIGYATKDFWTKSGTQVSSFIQKVEQKIHPKNNKQEPQGSKTPPTGNGALQMDKPLQMPVGKLPQPGNN